MHTCIYLVYRGRYTCGLILGLWVLVAATNAQESTVATQSSAERASPASTTTKSATFTAFSSFLPGTRTTDIPLLRPPPAFAENDSYLIDTAKYCRMDTEPGRGGVIIGGFFEGHADLDAKNNRCHQFLDWGAVELTETYQQAVDKIDHEILNWKMLGRSSAAYQKQRIVGTYVRDTCTSSLMGMAQAETLAQNSSVFESYARDFIQSLDSNGSALKVMVDPCKPPLVMLVGLASSKETATVSPLLSVLKIPHISFWATSTQFDKISDYPYLFRTVPSDNYQTAALADIIEYFGWSYIILIGASDEIYSGRGMELLEHEAERRGTFCIALEARFTHRNVEGMLDLAELMEQPRYRAARVVVIFAPLAPAREMLHAMQDRGVNDRVVLGSDDWVNQLGHNEASKLFGKNTLFGLTPTIIGNVRTHQWIKELQVRMRNFGQIQNKLKQAVEKNPWLRPYMEGALGCQLPLSFQETCSIPQSGTNFVNQHLEKSLTCNITTMKWLPPDLRRAESLMYALELTARAILSAIYRQGEYTIDVENNNCHYPRGEVILESLKNLKVPCDDDPSGECLAFNEFQSVWPVYKLRNWNHRRQRFLVVGAWDGRRVNRSRLTWNIGTEVDFSPQYGLFFPASHNRTNVPESTCSQMCLPGERRVFHIVRLAHCCWMCMKCDVQTVSSMNNSDACMACQHGEKPNADQSACLMIQVERISFSNPWAAIVTALAVLGAALAILTLGFFWHFRTCYLVRAADFCLTSVILTGVIMGQLLSLLLLVKPNEVTCRLPPILTGPWAILTASGILVKTNRFHLVFTATTRLRYHSRGKRLLFSTGFQLAVVGAFTAISVVRGVVEVLVNPPVPEKIYPDSETVYLICSNSTDWIAGSLAYLLLLLLVCAILAFQTRNLPDNYNEAKLVAMAAFTTCVVWLGFSPAVFITESSFRPVILAIALVAQLWAVWACLYVPRLIPMLRSQGVRMSSKPNSNNMVSSNLRFFMSSVPTKSTHASASTTVVSHGAAVTVLAASRPCTPASMLDTSCATSGPVLSDGNGRN